VAAALPQPQAELNRALRDLLAEMDRLALRA